LAWIVPVEGSPWGVFVILVPVVGAVVVTLLVTKFAPEARGHGVAATFNTPIGGVMFAVELMMPEVSVRTFLPVALATGTATFIARLYFGLEPAFHMPSPAGVPRYPTSFSALLLFVC
jgi:H+/Cl- antiporter ClcA